MGSFESFESEKISINDMESEDTETNDTWAEIHEVKHLCNITPVLYFSLSDSRGTSDGCSRDEKQK